MMINKPQKNFDQFSSNDNEKLIKKIYSVYNHVSHYFMILFFFQFQSRELSRVILIEFV